MDRTPAFNRPLFLQPMPHKKGGEMEGCPGKKRVQQAIPFFPPLGKHFNHGCLLLPRITCSGVDINQTGGLINLAFPPPPTKKQGRIYPALKRDTPISINQGLLPPPLSHGFLASVLTPGGHEWPARTGGQGWPPCPNAPKLVGPF